MTSQDSYTPFPGSSFFRMVKAMKFANNPRFIVSSLIFIVFLCALSSINEIHYDHLLKLNTFALSYASFNSSYPEKSPINSSNDEIRILFGILTLPDQYPRRHFLRLIYGTQPVAGAKIDVKFVFCNTYFSSLPDMLNNESDDSGPGPYPPYHYVMKGDDDSYFRLEKLVETLRPLPREDLYYGYVIPCPSMDPFVHYMSGMGYLISWDIVEWIRDSDIPKNHLEGPEDKVFGDWIREGHKAKNRYNAKWSMYNYPEPHTGCTHELWPNTVAVHLLKTQEKWIRTLEYFNVTQNLKFSKMYHIP